MTAKNQFCKDLNEYLKEKGHDYTSQSKGVSITPEHYYAGVSAVVNEWSAELNRELSKEYPEIRYSYTRK